MRVQEQFHDRKTSQSLSRSGGAVISPTILPLDLKDPSHGAGLSGGGGGMIWTIGSPLRVTSTGRPVRFTLSKMARQVDLNFEMGIFSTLVRLPWSLTIVNSDSVPWHVTAPNRCAYPHKYKRNRRREEPVQRAWQLRAYPKIVRSEGFSLF